MDSLLTVFIWATGGLATLLVAAVIYAFVSEMLWPSPILATLKKSEWECTASHTERYTTTMLIGKITVPMQNTRTVCDRYERNE